MSVKGIVLYTDGSSRPSSRGYTGWGVHGYSYTDEDVKTGAGLTGYTLTNRGYFKGKIDKEKNTTDLKVVKVEQYYDMHGADTETDTNNGAELDALYYALVSIQDESFNHIQVYTDSEYLKKGITEYVQTWIERQWTKPNGTPIPNAKQWMRLVAQIESLKVKGTDIRIGWVRGHDGNIGNHIADILAGIASIHAYYGKAIHDITITPAKGYWKHEPDRHPFLAYKRLYFNASPQYDKPGIYYTASPGKIPEHVFGNRSPESAYCVMKVPSGIEAIDKLKQIQHDESDGVNAILRMDVDTLYHRYTHDHILKYGRHCINPQANLNDRGLTYVTREVLTQELNQGGLTLRAFHCFSIMEELLSYYEWMRQGKSELIPLKSLMFHDITSLFYDTVKDKMVLRPEFKVGFTDMMIDVTINHRDKPYGIRIPFSVGLDVLPRNHLKRIEGLSPTITLMTMLESENSVRYACVVQVGEDIGIWSNYYTDCIYLPD